MVSSLKARCLGGIYIALHNDVWWPFAVVRGRSRSFAGRARDGRGTGGRGWGILNQWTRTPNTGTPVDTQT